MLDSRLGRERARGMHAEDIKAALRKKWGTLEAFSAHLGRCRGAVSLAITYPGYSVPVEKEVAADLGLQPRDVWPDRYQPDGTPRNYKTRCYLKLRVTAGSR